MRLRFWYHFAGNHDIAGPTWYSLAAAQGEDPSALRYTKWLCNPLSFLAQDVGGCDSALALLSKVRDGSVPSVMIEGEDTTATASLQGVQIDIELAEETIGRPEGRFSLAEFIVALEAWRRLLLLSPAVESEFTVELPS